MANAIDAKTFRSVMGLWPTGVSVVTGRDAGGEPLGMVIGSFTSVSLEPPLVAFCPQKTSGTWNALRESGRVSVNFLNEQQADLCWQFATGSIKGRFDKLSCGSDSDLPRLPDCCAWLGLSMQTTVNLRS